MIKAIIFDCDGTLVDSEEAHIRSWELVIQPYGESLTAEEWLHFIGRPDSAVAETIAKRIPLAPIEELWMEKQRHFANLLHQGLPPIEGTVQFVHTLLKEKERLGLKLAVASAASKHEILVNLKSVGLADVFDLVLSGGEDLHEYEDPEGVNKPKPYIYLHAAKLLGLAPHECVAIEDSHTGVTSAVDAGCLTVAIPTPASKSHDLSRATKQIDSLAAYSVEDFFRFLHG